MTDTQDRDILITELNKDVDSQQEIIEKLATLVVEWSNTAINAWITIESQKAELVVKRTEEDKVKYWTGPWTWV